MSKDEHNIPPAKSNPYTKAERAKNDKEAKANAELSVQANLAAKKNK